MERRVSSRLPINETTIFTKDGIFTAILGNFGMGGLFLVTNKPIEVGEIIEVTIPLPTPLPGDPRKKIVVDAVAIRVDAQGIAFKYHEMDDDTHSVLLFLTSPQPGAFAN